MKSRVTKYIVLRRLTQILVLLSILNLAFGPALAGKIKEGNRLFKEEKYDEALTKYTDAQLEDPESPELYFNIADTLYRQRKYSEAEQLFVKAIPQADTELEAKIYYNIGNCKYRQGQLRESIEYYKKALELNPEDRDAKYNIEFVERKIKEMLSKAKDRMEKQQKEHQKQEQQAGTGATGAEEEKEEEVGKETEGEKKQAEEEKEVEGAKPEEGEKAEAQKPEELSKEEAEALLRMMAEEERTAGKPKQRVRRRPGYYPEVEKPW